MPTTFRTLRKIIVRLLFRPLREVYHLWTLAGGDLEGELKKRGLIKTKPPIMSLPMYVLHCIYPKRFLSLLRYLM